MSIIKKYSQLWEIIFHSSIGVGVQHTLGGYIEFMNNGESMNLIKNDSEQNIITFFFF